MSRTVFRSEERAALLLTTHDVARLLNVSFSTARRLIVSGELRSVKIGRSRRVSRAALEAFVAERDGGVNE